jgi:hypothetical protein
MRIVHRFFMLGIFGIAAGCDSTNATLPSTASQGGGSSASGASSLDSGSGASEAAASVDSGSSASESATSVDGGGGTSDATSGNGNGASDAGVANGSDGGSETATGDGGSEAGTGGGGDNGKVTSADGGGDAGSCTLPSCLGSLDTGCMPTGTCSQTTDDTTGDVYSCYANGITRGDLTDPNTGDQILTAKNATSTCYSIDYVGNDIGSDIATTATVTNRSDAGVATLHVTVAPDGVTTSWSVTCSGGAPVALDSACKNVWPLAWMINERNGPQDCTASTTCKF